MHLVCFRHTRMLFLCIPFTSSSQKPYEVGIIGHPYCMDEETEAKVVM